MYPLLNICVCDNDFAGCDLSNYNTDNLMMIHLCVWLKDYDKDGADSI